MADKNNKRELELRFYPYYIKAYEDRIKKAFEEMEQEGLTDYDSHAFIYDQGDFNAEEIVGYYFQTYKDKALLHWNSNTRGKKLDNISKKADKILNNLYNV